MARCTERQMLELCDVQNTGTMTDMTDMVEGWARDSDTTFMITLLYFGQAAC